MMRRGPQSLVVDTSAVLAVLLNEPARAAVVGATAGATILAAPSLPWEVGNALVALFRRRLAVARDVQKAWTAFLEIPIRYVDVDVPRALQLAVAKGLYAYDSYVLDAARVAMAPLLSLDEHQRRIATDAGLTLVEALS